MNDTNKLLENFNPEKSYGRGFKLTDDEETNEVNFRHLKRATPMNLPNDVLVIFVKNPTEGMMGILPDGRMIGPRMVIGLYSPNIDENTEIAPPLEKLWVGSVGDLSNEKDAGPRHSGQDKDPCH